MLLLTCNAKDITEMYNTRFVRICLIAIVSSLFSSLSYAEKDLALTKEKEKELQAVVQQLKLKKEQELKQKKALHTLQVQVTIDDTLKKKLPKDASLFVYARSISGPNKVIAYKKLALEQSTMSFTLSDEDAVRRFYKISHSPNILIGARISTDKTIISNHGKLSKKKDSELETLSQQIQNTHKNVINLKLTNESA